jgi:hypothetical protein
MSDLSSTAAKVFQYTVYIAVTYQDKTFAAYENNLKADIEVLNQFFHRWCLQPNPGNTEICVFHLKMHAANKQLDVMFKGTCIKHVDPPKYIGVTLEKAPKKVNSRVNLVPVQNGDRMQRICERHP